MAETGETAYVVLGSLGEYSAREVFVSGVFLDEKTARKAVEDAGQRRRAHSQWNVAYTTALRERGVTWTTPNSPEKQALMDSAEKAAGPKPQYEPSESCEIVEVTIGQWKHTYD